MISSTFIDRPRLAIVISIVITIAGLVSLGRLPVAQFPEIVPPQVKVTAFYPRRGRRGGRGDRRAADRTAGDRRRGHDLHEVDQRR